MDFKYFLGLAAIVTMIGCSSSNEPENTGTVVSEQRLSSANYQLSGAIDTTENFGAATSRNEYIQGTECSSRGSRNGVLEVRSTAYGAQDESVQLMTKSFIFSDPSEAWKDLGSAIISNTMLPQSNRVDVVMKVTYVNESWDAKIFEGSECHVTYTTAQSGNAIKGQVTCHDLTETSTGETINLSGNFTCDEASL